MNTERLRNGIGDDYQQSVLAKREKKNRKKNVFLLPVLDEGFPESIYSFSQVQCSDRDNAV